MVKASNCVINCRFLLIRKVGYLDRSREYRCLSPKAPEKSRKRVDEVQGRKLGDLESCPEGFTLEVRK